MTLRIDWVSHPGGLEAVEPAWRTLESAVASRTHLSSFDFLYPWYRHYAGGYGGTPLVGLAWRGRDLVGVAPLTRVRGRTGRVPVRRVELAPSDVPAGECLVDDRHPDVLEQLIASLLQAAAFDVICLDGFTPASGGLAAVERAAGRLGLHVETEDHACALVDLRQGYPAYFRGLSGNTRRKLTQKSRRVDEAGGRVESVHLTASPAAVEGAIARMIAITEASYKLEGRRLADCHRGFLTEVATRLAARNALSLPILTIGGRDAAFVLGAVERERFYDISLAYDESFAKLSPGAVLMQRTLAQLAGSGVHMAVSHGAHEYKTHWTTAFAPQRRVFLFPPGVRATAARLMRFGLAPLWARFGPHGARPA